MPLVSVPGYLVCEVSGWPEVKPWPYSACLCLSSRVSSVQVAVQCSTWRAAW